MYCRDGYVLTTRLKAKSGHEEELKAVLARAVQDCNGQVGLLLYSMHQDREDPMAFMLYAHFTSEASFRLHIDSPAMRKAQDAYVGIIKGTAEVIYWALHAKI